MNRKKVLIIYGFCYLVLVVGLVVGLKTKQKSFNQNLLEEMINSDSKFMPKLNNLCQTQLLGEPKVGKDYFKISFHCLDGSKSLSTLALGAFADKSIFGVIDEYGKIVNFEGKLSESLAWSCLVNDKELDLKNGHELIPAAATIDCYEKK